MTCVFTTYSRYLDTYARAAQQQWGSQGIWIPETTWFNGLEDLPDNIAAEMRDLYLARKPWNERSKEFDDYARNKNGLNSRWNYRYTDTQQGPFAWTSHVLSTTAKIANLYWLHYAYWPDQEWLRTTGYPMIKGTAEFYRNFPNLYKADDGKYHIRHVNNLEEKPWGRSDTPEELLAMRVMFPIAIRASEILDVDADLRPKWKEMSDNLLPVPPSPQPGEYYDHMHAGHGRYRVVKQPEDFLHRTAAAARAATEETLASFPENPSSPPISAWASSSRQSFLAKCIPIPKPMLPLLAAPDGACCEIA